LHLAVLIRRFRRSPEQHITKTLVVPFAVVVGEVVVSQNRIGNNVNEAMVLRAAPMGFTDKIGARTRI